MQGTPRDIVADGLRADPDLPTHIGGYEVVRLVARGGFGTVYEAIDAVSDERVAIKVLHDFEPASIASFKNEARFFYETHHPRLLAPDELIEFDGRLALVMRFVEGRTFVEALADAAGPTGPVRDADRFRTLVARLVDALGALAARGMLHLDVKPTNVLVAADDEVVVLDFGLSMLTSDLAEEQDAVIRGSPRYMAPEVLQGGVATEATDVYGVGLMVYEGLVGALPFDENGPHAIYDRMEREAPTVASLRQGIDAEWSELTCAMLAVRPSVRPAFSALGVAIAHAPTISAPRSAPALLERDGVLGHVTHAWAAVQRGMPTLVLVEGQAGLGRSTLLRAIEGALRGSGPVLTLRGRCEPREMIPFKALDGVVDQIAHWLAVDATALETVSSHPEWATLCRHFPVLAGAEAAQAMVSRQEGDGSGAAAAFAACLRALSRTRPVLLLIDDVHAGDADSAVMLSEAMSFLEQSRVMVVLTSRLMVEEDAEFVSGVEQRIRRGVPFRVVRVALAPLSEASTRRLARVLLGDGPADERVAAIAHASAGVPATVTTLCRSTDEATPITDLSDATAVVARHVDPAWLPFVRAVCVAGRATGLRTVADVAGTRVPDRRTLAEWVDQGVLRMSPELGVRRVAPTTEPFTRTVADAMTPAERRSLHVRLAERLRQDGADAGEVAAHFLDGGRSEEARTWALEGAERAEAAGAYGRAAALLQLALQVSGDELPSERVSWLERRGRLLLAAGDCSKAARAFGAAAAIAPRDRATALEQSAVDALFSAGEIPAGLERLRPLLHRLDLAPPATGVRGVIALLWRLFRLALRGIDMPRHAAPSTRLEAVDVCWAAGKGLVFVEPVPGMDFMVRALVLARDAGDPVRLSRALGMISGGVLPQIPFLRGVAARWIGQVQALAVASDDAYLQGVAALWTGFGAAVAGDLRTMLAQAVVAEERLSHAPDAAWELVQAQGMRLRVLRQRGELVACSTAARAHLRSAERRGDLYAQMLFGDYDVIPTLARGAVEEARTRIAWCVETWLPDRYTVQSFYAMLHASLADLYEGRPEVAAGRIVRGRASFRASGGYSVAISRIDHHLLEARVVLQVPGAAPGLWPLRKLTAALAADERADARAYAMMLEGCDLASRGNRDQAVLRLGDARRALEAEELLLDAACVAWRLGDLGEDEAAQRLAAAEMERLGVAEPARWARFMVPVGAVG